VHNSKLLITPLASQVVEKKKLQMKQKANFLEERKGEGTVAAMVTLWQHQHHAGQNFNKKLLRSTL